MTFAKAKYTGGAPTADSNTYPLFNSIVAGLGGNWPALHGVYKIVFDIKHDQAGTIKWYKNMTDTDSAGNWYQMGQLAVAAPAGTAGTQLEIFVEAEFHVKVDWVNAGVAQSPFMVDIAFADQRAQI